MYIYCYNNKITSVVDEQKNYLYRTLYMSCKWYLVLVATAIKLLDSAMLACLQQF